MHHSRRLFAPKIMRREHAYSLGSGSISCLDGGSCVGGKRGGPPAPRPDKGTGRKRRTDRHGPFEGQAYDDNAVVNISFSLDGAQIGIDRDGTNGWWISWDSDEVGDGAHTLTVVATDSAGQTTLESISVAINNADLPPHVAVTSPSDGAVVSGTVTITADASDDRAITHVSFAVGGTMIGVDPNATDGWALSWSSSTWANGPHDIAVTATDTAGQTTTANQMVVVDNPPVAANLEPVADVDWTETAIRKVLNVFANGGYAYDAQIAAWAAMGPETAIAEMLTFTPLNAGLSPVQDASAQHGGSLEALQDFWSSSDPDNPARADVLDNYALLDSSSAASVVNLQAVSVQASATRGLNPFLHKVAFYLTNYLMAVSVTKVPLPMVRQYYDDTFKALIQGKGMVDLIAQAAASAAVARQYGHDGSWYRNGVYYGSDDFAREFHQLFFRIQGVTEDTEYHEGTTIENTARMLTGMGIDQVPGAYGSVRQNDWLVGPINFSDHTDISGRILNNSSFHYADCLEILGTPNICGATAEEKIYQLAAIAEYHPESLDNIPVHIVGFFADDNLTDDKIAAIRGSWRADPDQDLLTFLRAYAISTAFHRTDTVKYRSAFARNLLTYNLNTLSNQESFGRHNLPRERMRNQGAFTFLPAHAVFGGQTGEEAAGAAHIFGEAFRANVNDAWFLSQSEEAYTDAGGNAQNWEKNWGAIIPAESGPHFVGEVARWLWERFISDDGKNYDPVIRAQLHAILATNLDFGSVVSRMDPTADPDAAYSSAEILDPYGPLKSIDQALATQTIALRSSDPEARLAANRKVGMAINLITMTPYMFAQEGR